MRLPAIILFLSIATTLPAATPDADAWCGTSLNPVPDLWQETLLDVEALEEFPKTDDWTLLTNRFDATVADLVELHVASVTEGARTANAVWSAQQAVANLRVEVLAAGGARDVSAYRQAIAKIRSRIGELREVFPPGRLRTTSMSMLPVTARVAIEPTVVLSIDAAPLVMNGPAQVKLRLTDRQGKPLDEAQLLEAHTRKLHALLVDSGLEDYHHEHPVPTGVPGEYAIAFTPQRAGGYALWLDVVPAATQHTETPHTVLPGAVTSTNTIARGTQLECAAEGLRFQLELDSPLRSGQMISARLRVTDNKGRPCFGLEPLMGAFAHIVGFLDDRGTYLHVHSQGRTPPEDRRGGPEVPFLFVAPKPGVLKLFVQTKLNGKTIVSKFSVPVE